MQNTTFPHFILPLKRTVLSYPSNKSYLLRSLDASFQPDEQALEDQVCICNEPLAYDWLFRRKWQGRPYNREDAERFFAWACEGWDKHAWFVFTIKDSEGRTAGTIDIKSAQLDGAEMGYMASARHRGIMTNTVLQVCALAKEAGYRRLIVLIQPANERSLGVAARAGFTRNGDERRDERYYWRFSKML